MSHEIDFSTGRAAYFGTQKAWHGLGTIVEAAQTSAEAIKLGGQDWSVSRRPIDYVATDGSRRLVADRFAIVRDDTGDCLSVMGDGYTPMQNAECFDFMDAICGEKLAVWESVGALRGGRAVFMLAKLPVELRVGLHGADTSKAYTLLVNSHDGTHAFKAFPTAIRVVCQNTLTRANNARGSGEGITIRHTASLGQRVKEARSKLQAVAHQFQAVQAEMDLLAAKPLNVRQSMDYFRSLYPTEVKPIAAKQIAADGAGLLQMMLDTGSQRQEIVGELLAGHYAETERQAKHNRETLDRILCNYDNSKNRLPGIEHTAWAAYNAVSEFVDHQQKYRGRDDDARAVNRLNSVLLGSGNNVKLEAYNAALALCS